MQQAAAGDRQAKDRLLNRHRERLRRMIVVRMDQRVRNRVDASDILQETLVQADRRLDRYLENPPLPFYPWLRQIAWDQLVDCHRKHLYAERRSRRREEDLIPALSDESVSELATSLVDEAANPLKRMIQQEMQERVRRAIQELPTKYREILVLRHLEQLSNDEAAEVLAIGRSATKMRHLRAVEKLRALLEGLAAEGNS